MELLLEFDTSGKEMIFVLIHIHDHHLNNNNNNDENEPISFFNWTFISKSIETISLLPNQKVS
jgi:hemolysin-activating ACP:hemolysin acyltransferase